MPAAPRRQILPARVPGRAAAALLLALAPAAAPAWTADNRLRVTAVTGSVFEVSGRAGSGASDYWCAAGDYARRVLGEAPTRRIYVQRALDGARSGSGRPAVLFSLSPPPKADTRPGIALSVRRVGDNLNAATAQNYCLDRKSREE